MFNLIDLSYFDMQKYSFSRYLPNKFDKSLSIFNKFNDLIVCKTDIVVLQRGVGKAGDQVENVEEKVGKYGVGWRKS